MPRERARPQEPLPQRLHPTLQHEKTISAQINALDYYYKSAVDYVMESSSTGCAKLLLDHQGVVAPLTSDPLHSLLVALGQPSLCSLLGAADNSAGDTCLASLGKTEVCLTLTPHIDHR